MHPEGSGMNNHYPGFFLKHQQKTMIKTWAIQR